MINSLDFALGLAAWVAVPLCGLTAALVTRMAVGSPWQAASQRTFLALMVLLSAGTLLAFAWSLAAAVLYGSTLATMSVAVVWDSGTETRTVT
ncbi:MAG: hypothetical protein HYS13_01510 [Planctomycetia bacterium]|nr:hypothetical protein [Planctomycetia bacterium]